VEWENFGKRYKDENRIAIDLEVLLKKEIDLVVLNRARSILAMRLSERETQFSSGIEECLWISCVSSVTKRNM